MERLKLTVNTMEKDVETLKDEVKKLTGRNDNPSDVHYQSEKSEFGIYSLEEYDTFRWNVQASWNGQFLTYNYNLVNPPQDANVYKGTTGISYYVSNCAIPPEDFEKKGPFASNSSLQKKLWEFFVSCNDANVADRFHIKGPNIPQVFEHTFILSFKHTYKIPPHVSFYVTPLHIVSGLTITIKEITCKQVEIKVTYLLGNHSTQFHVSSDTKLNYMITGVVDPDAQPNLLE